MKEAELVRFYTHYRCSNCGAEYTDIEYALYYSKYELNCKFCGALFTKKPPKKADEFTQLSFFEV